MSLRIQAALDNRKIIEDPSLFGAAVTLTTPEGLALSLVGQPQDIGETIDPETGQAVAGRRASLVVSRASLPAMPEAVADRNRKPWLATFPDISGALATWKVVQVAPDRVLGNVKLIVELYAPPTIALSGAPRLPALALAGQYSIFGALSGVLALRPHELAGELAAEVPISGELALPELALAGAVDVEASFSGALALPQFALSGSTSVEVSIGASGLALPQVGLAGPLTVGPAPMSAWLDFETATTVAGAYSSVPDLFSPANPATQATAARRPAVSSSPNGRPVAVYSSAGPTMLRWAIHAGNFSTSKLGFAGWFKWPTNDALAAIVEVSNGTSGASVRAFELSFAASGVRPQLTIFDAAGGVKQWQGPLSSLPLATRFFFRSMYDSAGATDADKTKFWVNESPLVLSVTGTGTGIMRPATGNIVLSNFNDSAINSSGFNGEQGPILWAIQQTLTAEQGLALMNYRAPN